MTRTLREPDREKTAERLLKSSATKFYDPDVDLDWAAPLVEGKRFIPEHRSSLYGTELWDKLTPEQRIELGKHEVASVATTGLWFEILLMQMLLKEVYEQDPTSAHAQYALTEVADECRHSTMFARMAARIGCPAYGPVPWLRRLAKLMPTISYGPARYGAILVAEEVLDRLQREQMNDPDIQPLVRMVNRIHVLEEVTRRMAKLSQEGDRLPAVHHRADLVLRDTGVHQPRCLQGRRHQAARRRRGRVEQRALAGDHPLGRRQDHAVPAGVRSRRQAGNVLLAQVLPPPMTAVETRRNPDRAHRFVTADGTALHVRTSGPMDSALTLVLVHGWTQDHRTWDSVVERLDPSVRVLRYDLHGHGGSAPASQATATIPQLADDLAELITSRMNGPVVLAGHSMGGMTIMELAERHPDLVASRVAGVAFVATSSGQMDRITLGLPGAAGRGAARFERRLAKLLARRRSEALPFPPSMVRPGARLLVFGDHPRGAEQLLCAHSASVGDFQDAISRRSCWRGKRIASARSITPG